jgi:NADP-dependent 3-hydroxy acid dehydrogenase YdfG
MNELYAIAIGRAIAYAIEQPGNFDVNEIIIGSTRQEL